MASVEYNCRRCGKPHTCNLNLDSYGEMELCEKCFKRKYPGRPTTRREEEISSHRQDGYEIDEEAANRRFQALLHHDMESRKYPWWATSNIGTRFLRTTPMRRKCTPCGGTGRIKGHKCVACGGSKWETVDL